MIPLQHFYFVVFACILHARVTQQVICLTCTRGILGVSRDKCAHPSFLSLILTSSEPSFCAYMMRIVNVPFSLCIRRMIARVPHVPAVQPYWAMALRIDVLMQMFCCACNMKLCLVYRCAFRLHVAMYNTLM